MAFKLGYEIPAGQSAFDSTRSSGPQNKGVAYCRVKAIKPVKKAKSLQAEIDLEVVTPASRKGETFKVWESVRALPGSKPSFAKVCADKVVTLLNAAGYFKGNTLPKGLSEGFDLEGIIAKTKDGGFPVYTLPGEGDKRPQVDILTREDAAAIEAGDKQPPQDKRTTRGVGGRGATVRRGTPASQATADPFDDDDAGGGAGDPFADDAGDVTDDPFA